MDSVKSELLKNLENLWRLWCKYKFGFSKLLEIRENIAIFMFEVKGGKRDLKTNNKVFL